MCPGRDGPVRRGAKGRPESAGQPVGGVSTPLDPDVPNPVPPPACTTPGTAGRREADPPIT